MLKRILYVVLPAVMLMLAACSKSPAETVEAEYLSYWERTGEEAKQEFLAQEAAALEVFKAKMLEEYDEEDARELIAEYEANQKNKMPTDAEFNKTAASFRALYIGSTLQIVSEEISGDEAVVTTVITYKNGMKEDRIWYLKKEGENWKIVPAPQKQEDDGEDEENSEDDF